MLAKSDAKTILKMHSDISIYSPWTDKRLFRKLINDMAKPFMELKADRVLGVEARGFILGAAVAYKINAGFVLARKKRRMYQYDYPDDLVFSESCVDYSGQEKTLEIEKDGKGIQVGDRVIIVDDWYGTGEQGHAAIKLVERAGGVVVGVGIMLDDMTDDIRKTYTPYNLHASIKK